MRFKAFAKGVKADVAKGEITLTFTVSLDDETMETAKELAHHTGEDASAVELSIKPYQRSFVGSRDEVVLTKNQ